MGLWRFKGRKAGFFSAGFPPGAEKTGYLVREWIKNGKTNQGEMRMIIQTDRLEMVLLMPEQLRLWVEDISALERELDCAYRAEPLDGFFGKIVKGQLEIVGRDAANYLWHSFFFLIRKEDRVVVGTADFKGIPNEDGAVEIGYGLGKAYEHHGYMTEAVRALCEFAFKQDLVSSVIAETDLDGFASQKILECCGFKAYRVDETVWWRLL